MRNFRKLYKIDTAIFVRIANANDIWDKSQESVGDAAE